MRPLVGACVPRARSRATLPSCFLDLRSVPLARVRLDTDLDVVDAVHERLERRCAVGVQRRSRYDEQPAVVPDAAADEPRGLEVGPGAHRRVAADRRDGVARAVKAREGRDPELVVQLGGPD